jgi:4-oxalocrotonate tautomerase
MPLINVKVIEGVFTSSQRREIVQKLTETMVSIEGENMRGVGREHARGDLVRAGRGT